MIFQHQNGKIQMQTKVTQIKPKHTNIIAST